MLACVLFCEFYEELFFYILSVPVIFEVGFGLDHSTSTRAGVLPQLRRYPDASLGPPTQLELLGTSFF